MLHAIDGINSWSTVYIFSTKIHKFFITIVTTCQWRPVVDRTSQHGIKPSEWKAVVGGQIFCHSFMIWSDISFLIISFPLFIAFPFFHCWLYFSATVNKTNDFVCYSHCLCCKSTHNVNWEHFNVFGNIAHPLCPGDTPCSHLAWCWATNLIQEHTARNYFKSMRWTKMDRIKYSQREFKRQY